MLHTAIPIELTANPVNIERTTTGSLVQTAEILFEIVFFSILKNLEYEDEVGESHLRPNTRTRTNLISPSFVRRKVEQLLEGVFFPEL